MADQVVIEKEHEYRCDKCGMKYGSVKWARLCGEWCSRDGNTDELRRLIGQCLDMIRMQGNLIDKIAGKKCEKQRTGKTNNAKGGAI